MNFSCRAFWQFKSEEDSLRGFVVGNPGFEELPQFLPTDDDCFNKFRHFEFPSLRQVLNGRLTAREATEAARTHIPELATADPLTSSTRV